MREICGRLSRDSEYLKQLYSRFTEVFKNNGLSGAHADYVTAVALGDYLAETIVFGTDKDRAFAEAVDCGVKIYGMNAAQLQEDSVTAAWEFIVGWLVSNTQKFEDGAPVRFGYLLGDTKEPGIDEYFIIPDYLDSALRDAGFSARKTMQGLKERGIIVTYTEPGSGKIRNQVRKKIQGTRIWGYQFKQENTEAIPPM